MSGLELAVNKKARQQAEAWNQAHQVGAEVEVAMPDGSTRKTRTRSRAFHMFVALQSAQMYLEGFGGMVSLSRVRPGKNRPSAGAGDPAVHQVGHQVPAPEAGEGMSRFEETA